jgi:hypothetical protein
MKFLYFMVALAFVFVAVDTITVNSAQAQTSSDDVIDDDECNFNCKHRGQRHPYTSRI